MRDKAMVTICPDGKVEFKHTSPFWAVMIAGRDTPTHMINMIPHMEEYRLGSPEANHLGVLKVGISVRMPFLINTRDLRPGDVLVLPHDTGMPAKMCWEPFPQSDSE